MDNALNSLDRMAPYTGSGKVAPAHHSEKDKERKKPETLEESFEDELEKEQKDHRHDTVALHKEEQSDDGAEEKPEEPETPEPDGHVDLKA
ncbi:hypothetical protein C3F09_11130 [candidate division GN15 bacterium]|uniref:Uncharacterized protein n=1 Tax=candidate division GN15 bacterium TaxID=2072418 RepID=A0A855X3W0_9BACT|nr:MAG: hypothetical protein C3F09_11130 [candidate division GN15 bacterium]